jgi:hypothetical protein
MLWVGAVSAAERAEGVGALARAYLYGNFAETEKRDAEVALFSLLDDPSPIVRKSIAEAFASAVDAPHAIVLALANDQSAISSVVLGRSPLLCDADLIDCAAVGDAFCPGSDHASSASLDERLGGARRNRFAGGADRAGGQSGRGNCRLLLTHDHERFGFDGEVREALLSR